MQCLLVWCWAGTVQCFMLKLTTVSADILDENNETEPKQYRSTWGSFAHHCHCHFINNYLDWSNFKWRYQHPYHNVASRMLKNQCATVYSYYSWMHRYLANFCHYVLCNSRASSLPGPFYHCIEAWLRAQCHGDRDWQVPGCCMVPPRDRNSPTMSKRVKRRDNSAPIFRKCDALFFPVIVMRLAYKSTVLLLTISVTVCRWQSVTQTLFKDQRPNKCISGTRRYGTAHTVQHIGRHDNSKQLSQ